MLAHFRNAKLQLRITTETCRRFGMTERRSAARDRDLPTASAAQQTLDAGGDALVPIGQPDLKLAFELRAVELRVCRTSGPRRILRQRDRLDLEGATLVPFGAAQDLPRHLIP